MNDNETLGFKAEINGIEGIITNLKEYKAAMKAATDAQVSAGLKFGESSAQFKKAASNVDNLKSKMDSLNQTFKNTSSGSGLERVNNSLGTLREGLANADFAKFKAGLSGIGQAMSAIPIFLLINGFNLLLENFDAVFAFGKKFLNLYSAEEKAVIKLTNELEAQKEETAKVSREVSRELEVMTESGASHAELTAKKQELIKAQIEEAVISAKLSLAKIREVQNNNSIMESIDSISAALLRKIGYDKEADALERGIQISKNERNKENIAALNSQMELIKDLQTKSQVETIKLNKDEHEQWKKIQDEKRQRYLDDLAWKQKKQQEEAAWELQAEKDLAAMKVQNTKEEFDAKASLLDESAQRAEKQYADDLKKHEEIENAKKDITAAGINAGASLAELVGQIAINRAKGNANKELQIRKTMFNVDKAFNVARAVQDGIRSVQAALTIPPPFGQILAGINAGAAAVNVGKILATKFDGGSVGNVDAGSTGGGGNAPNIGGNINTNVPNIAPQPQQSTQFDENGKRITIKAELVETESRKVTERIDKFNRQREY